MKKLIVLIWATCMACISSPDLIQNQLPDAIEMPEIVESSDQKEIEVLFPEKHPATVTKKGSYAQLKKERQFQEMILVASDNYEIEAALIKAIIMAESSYNPHAISKVGAQGMMQLMPRTAKALGVVDVYNPEHNINGGVRYFKKLLVRYNGNIELALAAYNAGLRNVKRYNGVPPFKATIQYIKKVEKYHKYYKKQLAWEFSLV